jgi:tRNA(fMet)-specific endonuclease VapC
MNYTLDTNTITAIIKADTVRDSKIRNKLRKVKEKVYEKTLEGKEVFIDGISYYEVKRGLLATKATRRLRIFEEIYKNLEVIFLNNQTIFDEASEIYADLKQRGQLIGDADILIAAIAMTQNLTLVSDNTDHFQRIEGITLENWLK